MDSFDDGYHDDECVLRGKFFSCEGAGLGTYPLSGWKQASAALFYFVLFCFEIKQSGRLPRNHLAVRMCMDTFQVEEQCSLVEIFPLTRVVSLREKSALLRCIPVGGTRIKLSN